MTPPVLGFRPIRAARLRASKLPKPVICTFEPFFNSPAMMPLSSKSASIVRVASAFDILVRIASAMFSGKSEELIRRVRRAVIAKKQVQVFKSHLDARYAGLYSISSHDGVTVEAEPVDSAEEIGRRLRKETEVLAIDEAQFLDDGIIDLSNRLADQGVRVILAGTDVDFRGLPFGPMPTLMCIAEVVDKFQAICVVCGGPATRNQRLVNDKPAPWNSPTIMVGGRESYEARCRHCHRVPRADEDQTALL